MFPIQPSDIEEGNWDLVKKILRRRKCEQTIHNIAPGRAHSCRNAICEALAICKQIGAWIPLSYQEMGISMANRWGKNLEENQINRVGLDARSLSKDLRRECVIATGLGLFQMNPMNKMFKFTTLAKEVLLEAWAT